MDEAWAIQRPNLIEGWPAGRIVTTSQHAKRYWPNRIKLVDATVDSDDFFIGGPRIRSGRCSGQTAIGLAVAMAARRIVLLGFDMRAVDGRTHWHNDYPVIPGQKLFDNFLHYFGGWQLMAERAGVEILNATPDSALKEFPEISLDAALALDGSRA